MGLATIVIQSDDDPNGTGEVEIKVFCEPALNMRDDDGAGEPWSNILVAEAFVALSEAVEKINASKVEVNQIDLSEDVDLG